MIDNLCRLLTAKNQEIQAQGRELLVALSGYDLSDAGLDGAELRGLVLSGVRMLRASLHDAKLSQIDLRRASLADADLSAADLDGARLSRADLRRVNLQDATLACADLYRANLSDADLSGANLIGADLRDADLSGADLRGAVLCRARLDGAVLIDTRLEGADLRASTRQGMILDGAIGDAATQPALDGLRYAHPDADLSGADLSGWRVQDLPLWGADLRGADLRGARLVAVDLSYADLRGAKLTGAWLEDCLLEGADLRGADLTDTTFINSPLPGVPTPPTATHGPPPTLEAALLAASRHPAESVSHAAIPALSAIGLHGEAVAALVRLWQNSTQGRVRDVLAFGLLRWCPPAALQAGLPSDHPSRLKLLHLAALRNLNDPEALAAGVLAHDVGPISPHAGFSPELCEQTARVLLKMEPVPIRALRHLPGSLTDKTWQDPELLVRLCEHGHEPFCIALWRSTNPRIRHVEILTRLPTWLLYRLIASRDKESHVPILVEAISDSGISPVLRGELLGVLSDDGRRACRPFFAELLLAWPDLAQHFSPDDFPDDIPTREALLDSYLVQESAVVLDALLRLAQSDEDHRVAITRRATAALATQRQAAACELLSALQHAGFPIPRLPEPIPRHLRFRWRRPSPSPADPPQIQLIKNLTLSERCAFSRPLQIGPETPGLIQTHLTSRSPTIRLRAVQWAAQVPGSPALAAAIQTCLADPFPAVRQIACQTLQSIGTEDALPALLDATTDRATRTRAYLAISHILQRTRPIR